MSTANSLNGGKEKVSHAGFSIHFIENDSIVLCKVHGYVSGATIEKMLAQCKQYTDKLASQGKPTLLMFDIGRVKGSGADARSAVQLLGDYRVDKCAVFGGSAFLLLLVQYVSRLAGKNNTRAFKNRRSALGWLQNRQQNRPVRFARVIAMLVTLAGLTILLGWHTDLTQLRSLGPLSDPINPTVGLGLVIAGMSLMLLTFSGAFFRVAASVGALFVTLFGATIVARWLFTAEIPVDTWKNAAPTTPTTAFILILLGCAMLLAGSGLGHTRLRNQILRLTVIVAAFTAIAGFVGTNLTSITIKFSNEYIILLAALISMGLTAYEKRTKFPVLQRLITRYWQGLMVFVILFVATMALWQQAKSLEETDTLNRAVDIVNAQTAADVDILRGFKAFFNSSTFVDAAEFDSYFSVSDLRKKYSGITHVGFLRNETTNPSQPLYPVTYVAPTSNEANYGLNFARDPAILSLLEAARDRGQPIASDSAVIRSLIDNEKHEALVAIAIYTPGKAEPATVAERRQQLYGFVIAEFDYDVFFQNFFREFPDTKGTAFIVTDPMESDRLIYQSPSATDITNRTPVKTQTITVAEHSWDISLLRKDFQIGDLWHNPGIILISGTAAGLLIALLIVSLVHRRYQALKLAEAITEDLEVERNRAVYVAQKDETILANIGDGLIVTDAQGKVLLVNDKFCEIFILSKEDVMGSSYTDTIKIIDKHGKAVPSQQRYLIKALKNNERIAINMVDGYKYKRGDGSYFPAAGSITPINSGGKVIGAIEVIRDASVEAKIDQAKTEFVSLASHQLRTPLTAAKWYTELLLQGHGGKLQPEQEASVREIYTATNRTIKLVAALLNLSRVEMGSVAIEPEVTDVPKLAHDIVRELARQIAERKLHVHEKYTPESFKMRVDPRLVHIMIENLMTNAVKYTPEDGNIEVSVSKRKDDLLIEVSDTGYGIPKDQHASIFTKLFRADNIRNKSTEGVGLGLYLVKSIVDYLGGKIWFESVENEGTIFHIQLPANSMKKKPGKPVQ